MRVGALSAGNRQRHHVVMGLRGVTGRGVPWLCGLAGAVAAVGLLPLLYRVRTDDLRGDEVQNWTETRVAALEQQIEYGPVNAAFPVPGPLLGVPVLCAVALLLLAAVLVARGAWLGRLVGTVGVGVLVGVVAGVVAAYSGEVTRAEAAARRLTERLASDEPGQGFSITDTTVSPEPGFWALCAAVVVALVALVPLHRAAPPTRVGVGARDQVGAALVALGAVLVGGGLVTELHWERPDLSVHGGDYHEATSVWAFASTRRTWLADEAPDVSDVTGYAPGGWLVALAVVLLVAVALLARGRAVGRLLALLGAGGLLGLVWSVGGKLPTIFARGEIPGVMPDPTATQGYGTGFWVLCAAVVVALAGAALSQRRPVPDYRPAGAVLRHHDPAEDDGVVVHDISGFDDDPLHPDRWPASGAGG